MITVLDERPAQLPLAMACRALGINRSTVYAWRKRRHAPSTGASTSRRHCPQPRALSAEERAQLLEIAHSEPYRDQPVMAVRLVRQYPVVIKSQNTIPISHVAPSVCSLPGNFAFHRSHRLYASGGTAHSCSHDSHYPAPFDI
ncbi:helix-turn-helix domain-containing protein [Modicisalibacter zincidurans]|uniref:helix-turn-helix domain-containing protein n=1 Tax=Modicisalibacter zincidurans TaxID=1178777 RepID=UPI0004DB4D64|nr:helix-turn-helix domain-containing protein [Halomonas zincidurans]